MKLIPLYTKKYKVEVGHIDFTKKMKLSSLFLCCQDCAGYHAKTMGMGSDDFKLHNALWVLARVRVDILRYPLWNDEIVIETWIHKYNRLEFMRDFFIKDINGEILAKATSIWAIIDKDTRKLKRISDVYKGDIPTVDKRAIDCKLGRLKSNEKLEKTYEKVVRYSDIDLNEHLNNAKYVDLIMDSFTIEEHKKHLVNSIEINFISESFSADTIEIFKDNLLRDSNQVYIEGFNKTKGQTSFRSRIFREKIDNREE